MRLKQGFLKIHFSNYACSVARVHPSDMPAKTPENLGRTDERTDGRTIQLSPTDFKGASRKKNPPDSARSAGKIWGFFVKLTSKTQVKKSAQINKSNPSQNPENLRKIKTPELFSELEISEK